MFITLKKFISCVLIASLLLSLVPSYSFAANPASIWNSFKDKAAETATIAANAADAALETAKDVTGDFAASTSTLIDSAKDIAGNLADTASNAVDGAKEILSNISLPDFRRGWQTASGFFGTTVASLGGQAYVDAVAASIEQLQTNVTSRVQQYGSDIASKAGFAAEEWHAGTFNIDAVARGLQDIAKADNSNALGSVDVSTASGIDASLKYYKTGAGSAKQQASVRLTEQAQQLMEQYAEYKAKTGNAISFDDWLKTEVNFDKTPDLYWELYQNQVRIIPSDQIDDAIAFLTKAIAKESSKDTAGRQAVSSAYKNTLEKLSDRLKATDGTESIPLTKEEAEAIARAGKDGKFKPSDFGVKPASVIKGSYIAKQAMKAGATSAVIETALVIGPEIYEIIKYLIETGEIDEEALKQTGLDGLSAAADGYLKGAISNALVIMCKAGKLGEAYVSASPALIGALALLVIDALKYGIMMANGKITTEEYTDIMAQELVVSAGALGSAALVGLLFPGASLAICFGSFIGGLIVSSGYTAGKEFLLAKIDETGVDMLVPIQATAESLKGRAAMLGTKVSDSLSSLQGIDLSAIRDKTISVFDFTAA